MCGIVHPRMRRLHDDLFSADVDAVDGVALVVWAVVGVGADDVGIVGGARDGVPDARTASKDGIADGMAEGAEGFEERRWFPGHG